MKEIKTYNDQLTVLYWAYRRQDGRWDIRDGKGNYHIRSFNLNIVWMLRHPSAVIKLIKEARGTTNFYLNTGKSKKDVEGN